MKKNLKDYELNELKTILGKMGEADYRAGQILPGSIRERNLLRR